MQFLIICIIHFHYIMIQQWKFIIFIYGICLLIFVRNLDFNYLFWWLEFQFLIFGINILIKKLILWFIFTKFYTFLDEILEYSSFHKLLYKFIFLPIIIITLNIKYLSEITFIVWIWNNVFFILFQYNTITF